MSIYSEVAWKFLWLTFFFIHPKSFETRKHRYIKWHFKNLWNLISFSLVQFTYFPSLLVNFIIIWLFRRFIYLFVLFKFALSWNLIPLHSFCLESMNLINMLGLKLKFLLMVLPFTNYLISFSVIIYYFYSFSYNFHLSFCVWVLTLWWYAGTFL